MKFAFDTDEVLRDTISKMKATYEKFFIEDYVSEEGEEEFEYKIIEPITSHKFSEHFLFPSESDYINFLYLDFPMNIFGHSPSMSANTFNTFSEIQKNVLSKRDKLSVIGMGVAKIKPASLFFYSKYGMEVDNLQRRITDSNSVYNFNRKNIDIFLSSAKAVEYDIWKKSRDPETFSFSKFYNF